MKISVAALRNPSPLLISHGAWSAVNVLVQLSAYLLLEDSDFAFVSLGVLAGSQGGQLGRAAALEAGLGDEGVNGAHVRLALAISIFAGLLLTGGVVLSLGLTFNEGLGMACSSAAVGAYDTARNTELLEKAYQRTRRSDLIWLIMTAGSIAVVGAAGQSPLLFLFSWAAGSLAALKTLRLRPMLGRQSKTEISWKRVLTFGGDYLSVAGATQVFTLAAAASSGVSAIATLRLAQLLLAPVNFVITGVRSVLYQSLEQSRRQVRGSRWATGAALVVGSAAAGLVFAPLSVLAISLIVLTAQRVCVLAGLLSSGVMRKFERLASLRWARVASVLVLVLSWFVTRGANAELLALCLLLSSITFLAGSALPIRSIEGGVGG